MAFMPYTVTSIIDRIIMLIQFLNVSILASGAKNIEITARFDPYRFFFNDIDRAQSSENRTYAKIIRYLESHLAVAEPDIHQWTCTLPHRKIDRDKVVRMFRAVVRMFHAVVAIEEVRKNF